MYYTTDYKLFNKNEVGKMNLFHVKQSAKAKSLVLIVSRETLLYRALMLNCLYNSNL
jgi:hypothetical protein